MADAPIVHIGDNSPEGVAFKLLREIATSEKKTLMGIHLGNGAAVDRKWILDTYAECLTASRGYRHLE